MRIRYWFRHCPLCEMEGELFINKDPSTGELYIQCDECSLIWDDPKQADLVEAGRQGDLEYDVPTREEIAAAGWSEYCLFEEPAEDE